MLTQIRTRIKDSDFHTSDCRVNSLLPDSGRDSSPCHSSSAVEICCWTKESVFRNILCSHIYTSILCLSKLIFITNSGSNHTCTYRKESFKNIAKNQRHCQKEKIALIAPNSSQKDRHEMRNLNPSNLFYIYLILIFLLLNYYNLPI